MPDAKPSVSKTLTEKLASVMGQIENLKESERHQQGWTFASVGSMYQAVRPLISQAGIIIVPHMTEVTEEKVGQTQKGNDIILTKAKFEMVVTDGVSEIRIPWQSKALDYDDKGVNKCATTAMKYFLKTFFLISTSDEADPDHSSAPPRQASSRPPARSQQRQQAPARAAKATKETEQPLVLLDAARAEAMAKELEGLGVQRREQLRLASSVLERQVSAFTQLSETEALEVWAAAKRISQSPGETPKAEAAWQRWQSPEDAMLWADELVDEDSGAKLFNHYRHVENAYNEAKREYAASLAPGAKGNARDMWRYWFEKTLARQRGEDYVIPTHGSQELFDRTPIPGGPIQDGASFEDLGKN